MRIPLAGLTLSACLLLTAQQPSPQPQVIYDEAKVPKYALPELMTMRDGQRVTDTQAWKNRRRPEILALYESEVYGKSPAKPARLNYEVKSVVRAVLSGTAQRKLVTIYFGEAQTGPKMDLLVYLPAAATKPVPVILALSFAGIHTIANDPGVPLAAQWVKDVKQPSTEESRGSSAAQWQVDKILAAGYGLAVFYYGDVEPDFVGGISHGIRPLYYKPGQTEPAADDWGAIAAWAWGASRAMDYLEKDPNVDRTKVALMGHSRLGKAVLWAGATDPRFSIVISNESGEGGAAVSRRDYGERTQDLNSHFPHWFDGNYKKYSGREEEMPFDSPMLLSLIAPRGLYVASAEEDRWSDPRGEFLGAAYASAAWALFGRKGIGTMEMPALHQPVGDHARYHIRAGKHSVTAYDWQQYLAFAASEWGH